MLVKLEMLNVEFDSFADAVDLISSFPSLEILVLSGNWNNHPPPTPYQHILPRHLHTLKLSCPTKDVLEWILSLDPVPIVSTLRLDYISLSQMPCIGEYLKILGSGLQHLTLYFRPATSGEATEGIFWRYADLTHNTELHSIRVGLVLSNAVEFVITTLSQTHNSHLEELGFPIPTTRRVHADSYPWAELDRAATRPQMSFLRRIKVDINPGMKSYIRERLPTCEQRGILQFLQ